MLFLAEVSNAIINKVRGINRVVYGHLLQTASDDRMGMKRRFSIGWTLACLLLFSLGMEAQTKQLHTVQRKETAYSIAKAYGVDLNALFDLNPWAESGIRKGDTLRIPWSNAQEQPAGESTDPPEPSGEKPPDIVTEPRHGFRRHSREDGRWVARDFGAGQFRPVRFIGPTPSPSPVPSPQPGRWTLSESPYSCPSTEGEIAWGDKSGA